MKRKLIAGGVAALVALSVATLVAQTPAPAPQISAPPSCGPTPPAELKHALAGSRCFEMRTYTFNPAGGNGNVQMLHDRFQKVATTFFKKHGITVIGVWKPVAKPDTLVYIIAFKDAATRNSAWATFQADPEWLKLRGEMNVSQTVVQEFMVAADYSPIK